MRARKPADLLSNSEVHWQASKLSLRNGMMDGRLLSVTKALTMSGQWAVMGDTTIVPIKFSKHSCTYSFMQEGWSKWVVAYRELFQNSALPALVQSFKPTAIQ